ncbi:cytochrome P450 [Kibdelosporangium aridum]|uniref:cytochrome P450 n=1 Tax=Kibdelosporangium aridum TaxID=2030 RepID=UPI0035E8C959
MTAAAPPIADSTTIPVAPGRLPAIGHGAQLYRNPTDFILSLSPIGELVRVYLGAQSAYAVTSAHLANQVLATNAASFNKGRMYEKMTWLGNGVGTSNDPLHRRQRRLMQPAFTRKMIALYAEVIRAKAEEMIAPWREGEVIDVQSATDDLTLSIGVATLFDTTLGQSAAAAIKRYQPIVMKGAVARTLLPDFVHKLPLPYFRRMAKAELRLRQAAEGIVKDYRADARVRNDLLTRLIAARDETTGQGMTDSQLLDELLTLTFGSAETTSSVLSSFFYRLSEHPDIAERVYAEIDSALGGRPVVHEDARRFPYTVNVLTEVLRLDLTREMVMRRSNKEVALGGYRLPAGSEFIISMAALHRNPEFYPDPHRFDPDRWTRRSVQQLPQGAFLPFGAGKHICPGSSLAWAELTIVAATVLTRWRLKLAPGIKPKRTTRITTPFAALPMTVTAR